MRLCLTFLCITVVWVGELNDIAEFLISLGCDPYFPDINGDTVFHYTVRGCNLEFLRSLFNIYGLRTLEVLNNNHFNLFLTAASESSDEKAYDILNVLEWLYLNGCSLESQDANVNFFSFHGNAIVHFTQIWLRFFSREKQA